MQGVGQLVVTGISGLELTQEETNFIENEDIGGVILFSQNYESPEQLAELVNSIQKLRSEYPLFIMTDHEGGRVIRFKKDFTQFPSMYEIAQLDSPKLLYEVFNTMALELRACGINVDLTPCCDIWTNPENIVIGNRSFGKTAEDVEKFVSAAIRGLQTNNVMACGKHFPGHGDTLEDSHYDLPVVKSSVDEIKSKELIPFIKAAKSRVEFMMMGHLMIEDLDNECFTTVSPKAYKFLRESTKFKKIIISDDMEMHAITKNYSTQEAAVLTLEAGADIVEYRSMPMAREALEGIKAACKVKRLKNADLQEKLNRVMDTKKRFLSEYSPIYIPDLKAVFNNNKSKQLLQTIHEQLAQKTIS
ncbi:MAG: beta-N-acetylhexosaminidase [bacterium]